MQTSRIESIVSEPCAVTGCNKPAETGHCEFRGNPPNPDVMVCMGHIWQRCHTCHECNKKGFGAATHCYKATSYPEGWVLFYYGFSHMQPPYGTMNGLSCGLGEGLTEMMFCPECRSSAEEHLKKI